VALSLDLGLDRRQPFAYRQRCCQIAATGLRNEQCPDRPVSADQGGVDRDHRLAPGMDGLDDLGVVDALQVDRRDAEVLGRVGVG
jgi:hypothetical protein